PEACARRYICSVTALPVVSDTVFYYGGAHTVFRPPSHTPYACLLHTKLLHVEQETVMAKRSKTRPGANEPGSTQTFKA
ncbi:hypothetical protein CROQUDRAFT_55476, partial [Cronartium quercuum f. sp. fusiforme G11]